MSAAKAMLDQSHPPLPARQQDSNTYILGRVGDHNVVIACLPAGVPSTSSAAMVAQWMVSTFERIRLGMMVGIGGGIPIMGIDSLSASEAVDNRLGDVIVSMLGHNFGGVIQHRSGRTIEEGRFVRTGVLNKPPPVLLTTIARLQSDRDMEGCKLLLHLRRLEAKHPNMTPKCSY